MQFDFEKFALLVKQCYQASPFSLEEVLEIFRFYFAEYERTFKHPHPHIKMEQIGRIIRVMPFADESSLATGTVDFLPDEYPDMIEQHFQTQYQHCDFNINHFFCGKIRWYRFLEVCL